MVNESGSIEYVAAWRCIGCGKIEAPQTCIGICQDRKVELVYRFEHEKVLAQWEAARLQLKAVESVTRQLAWTTPHADAWEHSYRALQKKARRMLESKDGETAALSSVA